MDKIQERLNKVEYKLDTSKLDILNYKPDVTKSKVDSYIGKLHPINSLGILDNKQNPLSIKLDNLNG